MGFLSYDDLQGFFETELLTPSINIVHKHLWLAGVSQPAHPLHLHLLAKRSIFIAENPNTHLLSGDGRIFIKPLASFLLDYTVWKTQLCRNDKLYKSACGFLWSYSWLINHESDLRIAREHGLVPDGLTWTTWAQIVCDFLDHFDDDKNNSKDDGAGSGNGKPLLRDHIDERYLYGELRYSRLAAIYRFSLPAGWPRWYALVPSSGLERKIAIIASFTVALSAMQVGLGTERLAGDARFQKAAEVVTVLSLVVVAVAIGLLPVLWLPLVVVRAIFTSDLRRRFSGRRKGEGNGRAVV
ncbi:hypothetical protein SLS58_003302 [Diplodia intermedia]|uniref:Subtilisin-like serine protease n=1 Tax=Diplodia intermedia TaxID=856260 RepID=A0ABR3TXA3_9PEZI